MSVTSTDREFAGLFLDPKVLEQDSKHSIRSQVIVTEYQGQSLIFPSTWVDEVMFFPRQTVLKLPFYHNPVLGIIPHHGDLVLLIEYPTQVLSQKTPTGQQERIRAIRLGSKVGDLAGAAILIDKIIGTVNETELDEQSLQNVFSPDHVPPQSFQPYRWM